MTRILPWLICALLFLFSGRSSAAPFLNAPHNAANGITCKTCHPAPFTDWPGFTENPADLDHTVRNFVCVSCHADGGSAPTAALHSSRVVGGRLANWSTQCIDCHDPHFQGQLHWFSSNREELYLATGVIDSVIPQNNTSLIRYTNLAARAPWESPDSWSQKTGDGRGLIFVADANMPRDTYEVIAADAATIVVSGIATMAEPGKTFGLIYGQLIRDIVEGPAGPRAVKLFDPKGEFRDAGGNPASGGLVDNSGASEPQGICQVCHTRTLYYRNNESSPAPIHPATGTAFSASDCTVCHQHDRGFAATHTDQGDGSGCGACHNSEKHGQHLDNEGVTCSSCHSTTALRDGSGNILFRDGRRLSDTLICSTCHHDGKGGAPNRVDYKAGWANGAYPAFDCASCHNGRPFQESPVMASGGHARLVGETWIRRYPCHYCHDESVDASGAPKAKHTNGGIDVAIAPKWAIAGQPAPLYNPASKVCFNTYCHSDGTTGDPEMWPYAWTGGHQGCNSCHGHDPAKADCATCHLSPKTWEPTKKWLSAMPMYDNTGPGTERANSHFRHLFTGFSCDDCHAATVNGACRDCHGDAVPGGNMSESQHIYGQYHVNRTKDVVFKGGGTYNPITKTCSSTACHTGSDPQWGGSVADNVTCQECHGTSGADVDDFGKFNGMRAKINLNQWYTTGHGRPTAAGNYPQSGNPPANFPSNACWYCHDSGVLHQDAERPFRLIEHPQFAARFEKECVYCHMQGVDNECLGCHNAPESLSPQLAAITAGTVTHPPYTQPQPDHRGFVDGLTSCVTANCHPGDGTRHKTEAGAWTPEQKADVKQSYLQMGVCLKCHDDDSSGQCTACHTGSQYALGYDPGLPGTGLVRPVKAKASSFHFGYKHYQELLADGKTRGGRFCWDCHDPHGDGNIFMVHDKVATETDGKLGLPTARATVSFTRKQSGLDYARTVAPYDGICNVCHGDPQMHYAKNRGDGHNSGRVCTQCHEHRFTNSHASGQSCNSCHQNKPVPRHTAFSLPRDCTKCHSGTIGKRMDIVGQFNANSHHVQGVELDSRHCYACHWEATPEGLIDNAYHGGFNSKTYASVKNDTVDLVIWGAGERPTSYQPGVTATTYTAANLAAGLARERAEVANVTPHCLSCHSDQNNDTQPFNDCKTPRQYAWDGTSVAARYGDAGTATWGKYTEYPNAAKKNITKAFSAHGNAVNNAGGYSAATGVDAAIPNTRAGSHNVQCFDCHSSHGSKVSGTTSSYVTFNNTKNGGNLKETQAGKGGYAMTYKASSNPDPNSNNPYAAGAGQCFDCHETRTSGATPWGYESTFGATAPIIGYRDTPRFTGAISGARFAQRNGRAMMGGHLKASSGLDQAAGGSINGLCTPCHDPHGVSPSLGADKAYGLPLLKGTWLTSPYREDSPGSVGTGYSGTSAYYNYYNNWTASYPRPDPLKSDPNHAGWRTDRNTFNTKDLSQKANVPDNTYGRIREDDGRFAGLCLRCHPKTNLTDGTNNNSAFKTVDRVHEAVAGWGDNQEHSFPCAKCHKPHASGLPRLMQTNCMNYSHRGQVASGGQVDTATWSRKYQYGRFPNGWWNAAQAAYSTAICHGSGGANGPNNWPNNQGWNEVTPW